MRKLGYILAVLCAVFGASSVLGVRSAPTVVRVPGACPFEGCQLGSWRARQRVPTFADINGVPGRPIRIGESVTAFRAEVRAWPRQAIVTHVWDTDRQQGLRVGNSVQVLHPAGEGTVVLMYKNRMIHGSMDLGLRFTPSLESAPLHWTWWVQVRLKNGSAIWLRDPQGKFSGMDEFSTD